MRTRAAVVRPAQKAAASCSPRGCVSHAKVNALRSSSSERLGCATNQPAQGHITAGTRPSGNAAYIGTGTVRAGRTCM